MSGGVILSGLPGDKLRLRTGKKSGSKFFLAWTLLRLTDEIERQIAVAGWHRSVPSIPANGRAQPSECPAKL
jgi:hypothetical protein